MGDFLFQISNQTVYTIRRFFDKCGELIKTDGVMIIYSGEKGILKKYLRLHKEYTLVSEILMDSKEDGNVYIIKKTV